MSAKILPYELYSDAPGILLNKPEWDEANAAHAESFDFGSPPRDWPTKFTGPEVWTGDYLEKNPNLYIRVLAQPEIEEIDTAIKTWKTLHLPVSAIDRSSFILPTLGPILRQLSNNIYNGVGVQVLRGFPIKSYEKTDQVIAFLGINSWVGDRRLNQGANRGICHIKSITHLDPSERGKIYVSAQDTNAQMYHSDAGGDVVSLMAVSLSGTGGASTVASAGQVYNHLAQYRPDIARILAERRFRWRANGIPDEGVRLIHNKEGRLFLNFSTRTFIGYGELPDRDLDFPALTFEEREAFGGWQWVAEQYSLKTELEVGDIEWVNNLHHQHARRGFSEDISNPRHLLRVWLRDSEHSPELPSDINNKFNAMFSEEPDFYPADEIEEDTRRRNTGIFTGSCKPDTASERLGHGGIGGTNEQVFR
ncbi:taurine catabolism dioxygenase family protein [Dactylonectria estremocensis]|uniref:Taurine catabolism dioxygenase family protein n=1 Tax=Dactylonectria estremocensis TaxID=1079267 RepID=A0A9P9J322_9HYPO|nr:taurine catabolism dioxygenase family protein [Dactylonectria estremocensis]